MTLLTAYRAIAERWRLIAATTAIGLIASAVIVLLAPRTYTSSSQLYVATQSASDVSDLSQGATYSQQVVKSLATVATSQLILQRVKSELHLPESINAIAASLDITNPIDTTILNITATARTPSLAARLADSTGMNLSAAADALGPSTTSARGAIKIVRIQRAAVPLSPTSPNTPLTLLIGLLLGLGAGVTISVLRDALRSVVRSSEELRARLPFSVIGQIPVLDPENRLPAHLNHEVTSTAAESFRTARSNLEFLASDRGIKVFVVVSSTESEGKSTSASCLSASAALAGKKVLLIDADLRRPRVSDIFGMEGTVGLADVLLNGASLTDAVQRWGDSNLEVLPAGSAPMNPGDLVQSEAMRQLLAGARNTYDLVILDSPPILPVNDAVSVAKHADAVLLHCALNRVRWAQVEASVRELNLANVPILGVVATFCSVQPSHQYSQLTR